MAEERSLSVAVAERSLSAAAAERLFSAGWQRFLAARRIAVVLSGPAVAVAVHRYFPRKRAQPLLRCLML